MKKNNIVLSFFLILLVTGLSLRFNSTNDDQIHGLQTSSNLRDEDSFKKEKQNDIFGHE